MTRIPHRAQFRPGLVPTDAPDHCRIPVEAVCPDRDEDAFPDRNPVDFDHLFD